MQRTYAIVRARCIGSRGALRPGDRQHEPPRTRERRAPELVAIEVLASCRGTPSRRTRPRPGDQATRSRAGSDVRSATTQCWRIGRGSDDRSSDPPDLRLESSTPTRPRADGRLANSASSVPPPGRPELAALPSAPPSAQALLRSRRNRSSIAARRASSSSRPATSMSVRVGVVIGIPRATVRSARSRRCASMHHDRRRRSPIAGRHPELDAAALAHAGHRPRATAAVACETSEPSPAHRTAGHARCCGECRARRQMRYTRGSTRSQTPALHPATDRRLREPGAAQRRPTVKTPCCDCGDLDAEPIHCGMACARAAVIPQ